MFEAGRGVPEEIAELVEQEIQEDVAEREKREATEQPPKTTKELIDATDNAVDILRSLFVRNEAVQDQLAFLSERVLFYLHQDGEPTLFASALLKPIQERSVEETATVSRILSMITQEVNPILYNLRQAILKFNAVTQAGKAADDIIGQNEGLLKYLQTGKVENQTVTTLFGYLEGLSATQKHVPQQFVVLNPLSLSKTNVDYWDERSEAHKEVTGQEQKDWAELIAGRSMRAVYELDAAADTLEREGKEHVADCFIEVSQFIAERIDALSANFQKTSKGLSFFNPNQIGMSAGEIINLLSAAEVVKHQNPQLYARLIGIAPGRKDAKATRSDLFGNIFHIALDKSLRSRKKPKSSEEQAGHQMIHDYLGGLCRRDAGQVMMVNVGEEQLDQMQSRLKDELQRAVGEQNTVLMVQLVEQITSGFSAKKARAFLEGISESKTEEKEEQAFLRDIFAIKKAADSLPAASPEKMVLRKQQVRTLAVRGKVTDALRLTHEYETEYSSPTGPSVPLSIRMEMQREIVALAPIEHLEISMDVILKTASIREHAKIYMDVVDRFLREKMPDRAFQVLRNSRTEKKKEGVRAVRRRNLFRLVSMAYCEEGRYQKSEVAEEYVAKVEGERQLCQQIIFYRLTTQLKDGLIEQAVQTFKALEKDAQITHGAADTLAQVLAASGRYEEALVMAKGGYSTTPFEVYGIIIEEKHKAGEEIEEEYEQYLESMEGVRHAQHADHYYWPKRLAIEKKIGKSSKQDLIDAWPSYKQNKGEFGMGPLLYYLRACTQVGALGQVSFVTNKIAIEFEGYVNRVGVETTMRPFKKDEKPAARKLWESIASVYTDLGLINELVLLAGKGKNKHQFSAPTAWHVRKERKSQRLLFVLAKLLHEKKFKFAEEVLGNLETEVEQREGRGLVAEAYLEAGDIHNAWQHVPKESLYCRVLRSKLIEQKIKELNTRTAAQSIEQVYSWIEGIQDTKMRARLLLLYADKLGKEKW